MRERIVQKAIVTLKSIDLLDACFMEFGALIIIICFLEFLRINSIAII